MSEIEVVLAEARKRMQENWDESPKLAAVAAFDATAMLLGQLLNEMHAIRLLLTAADDA